MTKKEFNDLLNRMYRTYELSSIAGVNYEAMDKYVAVKGLINAIQKAESIKKKTKLMVVKNA